jgi:hypothetical protein
MTYDESLAYDNSYKASPDYLGDLEEMTEAL